MIIYSDFSEVYAVLRGMERAPSQKGIHALGLVMDFGLAQMKGATHIETGSLESSEKADADHRGALWSAEIQAGGVSTGVHNPVDYAIYEQARGGAHDFTLPLNALDPFWVEAVEQGFTE